jgi:hypothetical protein
MGSQKAVNAQNDSFEEFFRSLLENDRIEADEMRLEYDLRGGVRGKYYQQYREGTNVVLLDSDVAAVSRDSEPVNQAL